MRPRGRTPAHRALYLDAFRRDGTRLTENLDFAAEEPAKATFSRTPALFLLDGTLRAAKRVEEKERP